MLELTVISLKNSISSLNNVISKNRAEAFLNLVAGYIS